MPVGKKYIRIKDGNKTIPKDTVVTILEIFHNDVRAPFVEIDLINPYNDKYYRANLSMLLNDRLFQPFTDDLLLEQLLLTKEV